MALQPLSTDFPSLPCGAFADSLVDALVVAGPDDLIAYANRSAERMFGYAPGELAGQSIVTLMPERYRSAHADGMRRLAQGQNPRLTGRSVQLEGLRRDGSEFPIDLSLSSWRDDTGLVFGAIIRDLTERRATELRERTLLSVLEAIAASETLAEGVTRVIETLCHAMEWQIGTTWLVDPRTQRLCCTQYCDIRVPAFSDFERETRELTFGPGEGLPGMVFQQQGPVWIPDLAVSNTITRTPSAVALGLRSAFAFPLVLDNLPIGVIEFFSVTWRVPDDRFLSMMVSVGQQLGLLLARSTTLEAVTSIIEQMQVGVFVYRLEDRQDDRSLRMIAVNPAACTILSIEPKSVIGRTLDENFPSLRADGFPQACREVVLTQRPFEREAMIYADERITKATFQVKVFPLPRECVGVSFENVTERKKSDELLRAERLLLEEVTAGVDIGEVLLRIAQFVEQQSHGVTAAILKADESGQTLRLLTAPAMDPEFLELLSVVPVADGIYPCGTAAFLRKTVTVEDVAADPRFESYRALFLRHGVRATQSTPIISREGIVLGTLAMYHDQPRKADTHSVRVSEFATRIAALAMERSAAVERLSMSESRLRALLQFSADAVLLLDREGNVRYRSPVASMLGYTEEELIGGSAFGFIHPDHREWVQSKFRDATQTHTALTFSFRALTKDGATRWLEITLSNQLDHPILQAMIVNYRDVTDRVEAEERLGQQEQQYRAIVEAVTDAILIVDSAGKVVTANEAACEMHGYLREELIGMSVADLVSPSDLQKLEGFSARAAGGQAAYMQAVHLRKNGGELHVIANGTSFLLGGVPHLLVVISNVSEQRRMQQRLERADRISSLGRLSATIAHEMNNVLMGIMPFAEVVRRRGKDDPALQNAAAHILKSVERGKTVTQDILRFTRATGEPELRPLDGAKLLARVTAELRPRLDETVQLEVMCEEGLYLVGDSAQLEQVVTNLVMNAQDAMPDGGIVRVKLVTCAAEGTDRCIRSGGHGAYAHLSVSDSGHGIPAHVRPHIFEPLFTTKGSGGTGLGLAIVHQIVMAHGGQIDIDSDVTEGTTFHVQIRKSEAPGGPATSPAGAGSVWSQIRTVILVEDEPSVGEGISTLLRLEGVECEWLTTGKAAVTRLLAGAPDLLILDLGLPDISGIEVYQRSFELYPNLPTIFATGHGDHRMIEQLDDGARVGFLSKPYDLDALARQVQALVDARS